MIRSGFSAATFSISISPQASPTISMPVRSRPFSDVIVGDRAIGVDADRPDAERDQAGGGVGVGDDAGRDVIER